MNGNTHASLMNVQDNVLVKTVNGVSLKMDVVVMNIVNIKLLRGMMNMKAGTIHTVGVLKNAIVIMKMMKLISRPLQIVIHVLNLEVLGNQK